jgi:hypothetical protein
MHNGTCVWALALIVIAGGTATAAPVYGTVVSQQDYSGIRVLSQGGGLGSAPNPDGLDLIFPLDRTSVGWLIWNNPDGTFTYIYSLSPLWPETQFSHFILELSQGCIVEGQSDCILSTPNSVSYSTDWNGTDPGSGNLAMPNSIYGVKFSTYYYYDQEADIHIFSFTSDRIPVWGNFYAKKGADALWNLGLETAYRDSDNTLYFIPRPDTESVPEIPEPGTMALLGAGLTALGLLRRRN